jgi:cysteine-rich repeat protein
MRIVVALLGLVLVACGSSPKKTPDTCGNGMVDDGEDCDGGANCKADCTFACTNASTDCPAAPDCGVAMCSADHACMVGPANDGTACGSNGACQMGMCVPASCGNGIAEPGEQCDFGSDNGLVAGCQLDCTFSCSGNSCDDSDPCNGVEVCSAVTHNGATGQACGPGTAEADGTSCGSNMICKNAACIAGVCGDGFTTGTEECDDANQVPGDGCENDCTFSCVSTDTARNCTPADMCAGQGTCNDATHICAAGTALPDNTFCGTTGFCKTGVCTQPTCGNGIVERGEDCDGGTGCKADCHWQCVNAATDCSAAPECQKEQCSAQHTCQAVADPNQNTMSCGTGGTCNNGTCQTSGQTCGNGIVEGTEQCDFGNGNGAGTGCEVGCTYSCQSNANCLDTNACNGAETCGAVTVGGHAGQKCFAGTPEANGTSCGAAHVCIASACVASTCGDGYVDPTANESCEPPNANGCDAHCQKCGDGILSTVSGEQCDDSNTANLDGCNASCKFEQIQRMTSFKVAFLHDATCTADALGEAIVGNDAFGQAGSRTQITQAIDSGIADGSITVELAALGLNDLTGTSDTNASLKMGILGGAPATSTAATYNGTNDLDWWIVTDAASINPSTRVPVRTLPAKFTSRTMSAGPGEIVVTVSFVGVAVTMDIFNATLTAGVNASGALTMSSNGMTPGHLASEQDAPSLSSFLSMGTAGTTAGCSSISGNCRCFNVTGTSGAPATCPSGELCGLVTARSLYKVAAPSALTSTTCNNFYTTTNTMLDIYVSGCKYAGLITEVKVTQPDTNIDGTSDKYVFAADANHNIVSCTKNGAADTLNDCLDHGAYSSLFHYTSDRVIAK